MSYRLGVDVGGTFTDVVGKRRDGVTIHYRIIDERVVSLCRTLCQHLTERDPPAVATRRRRKP